MFRKGNSIETEGRIVVAYDCMSGREGDRTVTAKRYGFYWEVMKMFSNGLMLT